MGEAGIEKGLWFNLSPCQRVCHIGGGRGKVWVWGGGQMVAAGAVVCHPEWPVPLVDRFLARVLVLEPPIPVLQGQQVRCRLCCLPLHRPDAQGSAS